MKTIPNYSPKQGRLLVFIAESLEICDPVLAFDKSKAMVIPTNITLLNIPPCTPEMNPIEQIWRELRTQGFRNEVFSTLEKVVDRLCQTISNLTCETVASITQRDWICKC